MPTPLTLHRSWETLTPAGQWPKHTTHAVCPCASKFCPSAGDSPMDKDFHLPTLRTGHLQLLWNLSSNITVTRNCLLPSFHFSYLPTKPNISQLLNSFTTTGNKLPQLLFYLQRSWQWGPTGSFFLDGCCRRLEQLLPSPPEAFMAQFHGDPCVSIQTPRCLHRCIGMSAALGILPLQTHLPHATSCSELAGSRRITESSHLPQTEASPPGTDAAKPADLSHANWLRDISPSHFPKYLT